VALILENFDEVLHSDTASIAAILPFIN